MNYYYPEDSLKTRLYTRQSSTTSGSKNMRKELVNPDRAYFKFKDLGEYCKIAKLHKEILRYRRKTELQASLSQRAFQTSLMPIFVHKGFLLPQIFYSSII